MQFDSINPISVLNQTDLSNNDSAITPQITAPAKKSRGRPRKNPLAPAITPDSLTKKKRGRPKKIQTDIPPINYDNFESLALPSKPSPLADSEELPNGFIVSGPKLPEVSPEIPNTTLKPISAPYSIDSALEVLQSLKNNPNVRVEVNIKIIQQGLSDNPESKFDFSLPIRLFVFDLLNSKYNLNPKAFRNYKEIAIFINSFTNTGFYVKTLFNEGYISKLKNREGSKVSLVHHRIHIAHFIDFVKIRFPEFDSEAFLARA